MASVIAIISSATHYAFDQYDGVALKGKLGYVYVDLTNGKVHVDEWQRCHFPAYHTLQLERAQREAAAAVLKSK